MDVHSLHNENFLSVFSITRNLLSGCGPAAASQMPCNAQEVRGGKGTPTEGGCLTGGQACQLKGAQEIGDACIVQTHLHRQHCTPSQMY